MDKDLERSITKVEAPLIGYDYLTKRGENVELYKTILGPFEYGGPSPYYAVVYSTIDPLNYESGDKCSLWALPIGIIQVEKFEDIFKSITEAEEQEIGNYTVYAFVTSKSLQQTASNYFH
jgi:hypothetical protein